MFDDATAGEPTRGASTITMQTVKNLFLWQGRSFVRKALEAPLALYFDALVSKRRIMEIYLNVVEWGPRHLRRRSGGAVPFQPLGPRPYRRQAALLAVSLPNPATRTRRQAGSGLRRLAGLIERRAAQSGDYVQCID